MLKLVGQYSEKGGPAAGPAPIDLAHEAALTVGPLTIDPGKLEIRHADGRAEALQPRVMQSLVALARKPGTICSRDDLIALCWNRAFVSEDAINRVLSRLRRLSEGLAAGVFRIETIPRVGHRLTLCHGVSEAHPPRTRRIAMSAGVLAGALLLAGGMWWSKPRSDRPPAAASVTIAVLPFRDLGGGNAYFAEGVSEEILSQLATNPALSVVGRTSSLAMRDASLDAPTVGRKLNAAYLVEGSVRSQRRQVRVDVALVRAADGVSLWAQRYHGSLDDIFSIEDQVAAAVSRNLRRLSDRSQAKAEVTSGDVYALYLAGKGLIRDAEPATFKTAVELLTQVVRRDPDYAPGWTALATATSRFGETAGGNRDPQAVRAEALRFARRGLALKPDLGQAHATIGILLGGRESIPYLERAVALDPSDAQSWLWLSSAYEYAGDFPRTMMALRRAVAIDPLWWRAFYSAAEYAWAMGYHGEAERYVRSVERDADRFQATMVRGDMAWRRGDFSEQFRRGRLAAQTADVGKRYFAELAMGRALHATGYLEQARAIWHHYPVDEAMWRMWRGRPPPRVPAQLFAPGEYDEALAYFTARTLLNAGRAADVVRIYDAQFASPEALLATHPGGHLGALSDAPAFALALNQAGRSAEARGLLRLLDAQVAKVLRRGSVPRWYYVLCAQLWAAEGNDEAAIAALQAAVRRGWFYAVTMSLPDIADEPAFRRLRADPRFQRLRHALNANVARERREITPLLEGAARWSA